MPLPVPPPRPVQTPAGAGIGLRFNYHSRLPLPDWPSDWWQRNYDSLLLETDAPDPLPLTERQMRIPPPPSR